jgi:RHS repeat-associated protein
MLKKNHLLLLLLFFSFSLAAQQTKRIVLSTDKSGYSSSLSAKTSSSSKSSAEVVPSVNGELQVNAQGALTYTVPIEVFKGINNFQPNLALSYTSDAGNGQAGYGWNLVGLSVITQGGKSKRLDDVYEGVQFNGTDPYYLDGQRLIQINSTDFITEHYSHIKIKKLSEGDYSFMIQYPDGKIAMYKNIGRGQHYIAQMLDSYDNEIIYSYTTSNQTPYLDYIEYGKTTESHPFQITFNRKKRNKEIKVFRSYYKPEVWSQENYRNHIIRSTFINDSILENIEISSTQAGIYRKYVLEYDLTSLGDERLRKILVENADGKKLKPLQFNYEDSSDRTIELNENTTIDSGFDEDAEGIGGVTMGDFYGDGNISATYWVKRGTGNENRLKNSVKGIVNKSNFDYDPLLFTGKIIQTDNKLSSRDQIIEYVTEVTDETVLDNGLYFPKLKLTLKSKDLLTGIEHNATLNLRGSYRLDSVYDFYNDTYVKHLKKKDSLQSPLVSDFNGDGLIDIMITRNSILGSPTSSPNPNTTQFQTAYSKNIFIELGKYIKDGGTIKISTFTGDPIPEGDIIEFDGDGIPDILVTDKKEKKINIYKLNFKDFTVSKSLSNFTLLGNITEDTPLIYGDFNGDGLTDFMTPDRVFKLDKDTSAERVAKQIEGNRLTWRQYINTGGYFLYSLRDFTNAKLAYSTASSSYNHIKVHRSSGWQKFWSGIPDTKEYKWTDFGASSIMPIDINNDGRTDLISFKKFGRIKFGSDKIRQSSELENLSFTIVESKTLDDDCYNECKEICPSGDIENTDQEHDFDCDEGDCYEGCLKTVFQTNKIVNRIVIHENLYDKRQHFDFKSFENDELSVKNLKISPFSFFINSQQQNGLDSYKNKLELYDPFTNKKHTFSVNTSNFNENRINQIDNGTEVYQNIEYTSLQQESDYYTYRPINFNKPYPYFVHKQVPLKFMVNKVLTSFDEDTLTKEYRYENAIQHLDGKGFLGFQKTYVSDPYKEGDKFFWTISKFDPEKENQLVETTYGGFTETLTKTTMQYALHNKPNNAYIYLNTSEESKDELKKITITKTHKYDTELLLQETKTDYGSIGHSISKFDYEPEWFEGNHYYHGRITETINTASFYSDTFTTTDEYSDFNDAGIAETHQKYGHNTDAITTVVKHDSYGNKTEETVSATGVSSLTTKYTYDTTKRFVTSVEDPEGLKATSVVNIHGWLESETSPFGLTTTHEYDDWGNPTSSTNYLKIKTTLEKEQLSNGEYSLTTVTPNTPQTTVIFDKFDRKIKTKTESINNKWVVVDTEYDVYGKVTRQSEPYFEGETPSLWNYTNYDNLDRPIEVIAYNGKVVTTCYDVLDVTVQDGEKKTTKRLDALGNVTYHRDYGGTVHYKYYANGTLKEANYDGNIVKVSQDGWGNKTRLEDPSAGVYNYEYDALGRKLKQTTPKGSTTYIYDDFGKLTGENTVGDFTNISAIYEYDDITKLPTKIIGNNGFDNFEYETLYEDPNNPTRITGKIEVHPAFTYETNTTFDETTGKPDIITTTTTITETGKKVEVRIKNIYDTNGILIELQNQSTGETLWKINTVNAKGLTKQMQLGNGYEINNTYNDFYLPEEIKHYNNSNKQTALHLEYEFLNTEGLLFKRDNHVFNNFERFHYDGLHRLTREVLNGFIRNDYAYDAKGRITHSTDVGEYKYNNYQITKLNLNTDGEVLKNERGFANVTYNSYKKAVAINLENKERINYTYNLFQDRTAMYYGNDDENMFARPYRKYYSSDKAVEIKHNVGNNTWEVFTYLDGDPYSATAVQKNTFDDAIPNGVEESIYFLHRDYQNTILAITDNNGNNVEKRFFDAWGNLEEVVDDTGALITAGDVNGIFDLFIDRGYTGHEHLQSVGLIHMNGRLYDGKLRRFLSPDNFVQDPYNTQNFNRYAYVLNNPLMYTDPGGEIFGIATLTVGKLLVGALIGASTAIVTNGIYNLSNGTPFWYGMGKSGAVGALTAAVSLSVGATSFTSVSQYLGDTAVGIFGEVLPSLDIKIGDWSVSLNAVLLSGQGRGIGAAVSIGYHSGNFDFSYGFGITNFRKHYATGKKGWEFRNSLRAGWDDGRTGASLGTNFWGGAGEMKEFSQRTGALSFRTGDFGFTYENDGLPFGFQNDAEILSDGNDSYRTAALGLRVGDFSVKSNLFTGRRDNYKDDPEYTGKGILNRIFSKTPKGEDGGFGANLPFGTVRESGNKYRFGALYLGYKNLRIGINSDRHVRHPIQDILAHRIIAPQPGFLTLSNGILGYFQYQTTNKFTSW